MAEQQRGAGGANDQQADKRKNSIARGVMRFVSHSTAPFLIFSLQQELGLGKTEVGIDAIENLFYNKPNEVKDMNQDITCCFTGHRPPRLPWGEDEWDERCQNFKLELERQVDLAYCRGYRHFSCG